MTILHHTPTLTSYIIGDIGGTNARFQYFIVNENENINNINNDTLIYEKIYPSQKYTTLTEIIRIFINHVCALPRTIHTSTSSSSKEEIALTYPHPTSCCLAVAGPVISGRCQLTNVNWEISELQISTDLSIPYVSLINDFVAAGYGVLSPSIDLLTIHSPSSTAPKTSVIQTKDSGTSVRVNGTQSSADNHTLHPKAIIGAGTGLGEAYAVPTQSHGPTGDSTSDYIIYPTEGGHASFAAANDTEIMIVNHIKKVLSLKHVSVERLVSGTGIPYIYSALAHHYPEQIVSACHSAIQAASPSDKAAVISKFAKDKSCPLCVKSIQIFIDTYGAETGNLALKILPYAGIYIAGGVATKLLWAMQENNRFVNSFLSKGRMRGILERMPIYVATSKREIGLVGTQVVARRLLQVHQHHNPVKSLVNKFKSKL